MALTDAEWIDQLTVAVSESLSKIFGEGAELASNMPERIDRRYSYMFRYHVRSPKTGSRQILVKIPHESWTKNMHEAVTSDHLRSVAKREFEILTSIAEIIEAAGVPQLIAIRPGAFFPEFCAFFMEEFPLRMLKLHLMKPPIVLGKSDEWEKFEKCVELAGVWLKLVHDGTNHGIVKKLNSLGILEQLEEEISILEKSSGDSLDLLWEKFQSLYSSLQGCDVPFAAMHNDFHLGNIFVMDDGRVGVLDPNWVESGSIFEDLSSLLIYPLTRKYQILSFGLLFRSFMYRRYEQAVFRGYLGDSKVSLSMVYLYCAQDVLFKWREDEEVLKDGHTKAGRILSGLIAPLIRVYYMKLTMRYLDLGLGAL